MKNPFDFHKPTSESKKKMQSIRVRCVGLHKALLEHVPESRERSLAITNLEQAAMWANKAIAFNQPEEVVEVSPDSPVST
jgi:hypothetical protein